MSFHVVSDPAEVREVMRRTEDFLPTNALTSVVPLAPAALRILSRARFALPPVLASATGARGSDTPPRGSTSWASPWTRFSAVSAR